MSITILNNCNLGESNSGSFLYNVKHELFLQLVIIIIMVVFLPGVIYDTVKNS